MFNEDLHAYLDFIGLPKGQINERVLNWQGRFNTQIKTISSSWDRLRRGTNPYTGVLNLLTGNTASYPYSVRKIERFYTGACMQVRRDDLAVLDIGFDLYGNLDTTSLLGFAGAGSAYLSIWYNQLVGGGVNAVQAVAVNQPRIVNAGSLVTLNGKPAVEFDGVLQYLNIPTGLVTYTNAYVSTVAKSDAFSGVLFSFRKLDNIGMLDDSGSCGFAVRVRNDANILGTLTATQNLLQSVGGFGWDGANSLFQLSLNGALTTAASPAPDTTIERGALGGGSFTLGASLFTGKLQEFILMPSIPNEDSRGILGRNQGKYFGVPIA
jgi:hypothetical protein